MTETLADRVDRLRRERAVPDYDRPEVVEVPSPGRPIVDATAERADERDVTEAAQGLGRASRFAGEHYRPGEDDARLSGHLAVVYEAMRDGVWRTLAEIREITEIELDGSIGRLLRYLREPKHGAYLVETRRVPGHAGLWQYRVGPAGQGAPRRRDCRRCSVSDAQLDRVRSLLDTATAEGRAFITPEEVRAALRGHL